MFDRFQVAPSLPAADIERAKRWYEEKLGLIPTMELPDNAGLVYPAGGSPLGFLLYPSEFAGTAQNTAATWIVDDIEKVMLELRSRGVTFEEYEQTEYRTEHGIAGDELAGRTAWFKDSEGNILNIAEPPPGMPLPALGGAAAQPAG